MKRCILVAIGALSAACGGGDVARLEQAVVADSAGIEIVSNHAPAWTPATAWKFEPVSILTIGADDSDTTQQFQRVTNARLTPSGDVIVLADDRVRWFDSTGRFVWMTVQGSGPGEFQMVTHLLTLGGDSVRVSSGRNAAIFDRTGAMLSEEKYCVPEEQSSALVSRCGMELTPDGSWLTVRPDSTIPVTASNRPTYLTASGFTTPGPGHYRALSRVMVVPPARDTMYPLGLYAGIEQFGVALGGDRREFIIHPFYSRRSHRTAGGTPTRILNALNPAYEIEVWTPDGRLERLIRRTNGRRAPNKAEIDAIPEFLAQQVLNMPVEDALAAVPTPDSLPAVQGMMISSAGDIVIQREGSMSSQSSYLYDVFDERGRFLGELRLPPRTRLMDAGEDRLLCVRLDENDVPILEVYALDRRS